MPDIDLNESYRDEGWGTITDLALNIEPENVESQARTVARWAYDAIELQRGEIALLQKPDEPVIYDIRVAQEEADTDGLVKAVVFVYVDDKIVFTKRTKRSTASMTTAVAEEIASDYVSLIKALTGRWATIQPD